MDNREAKFILKAYRPEGRDAANPDFREALEQAERDPELGVWLQQERAFDDAFAAKLKEVPVPPNLKEEILAGQKIIPMPSIWQRPPALVAMAAAAVFAIGLLLFTMLAPDMGAQQLAWKDFQKAAINKYEDPMFRLKKMTDNTEEVRAWLAQEQAPRGFVLPEGMRQKPPVGCTTFKVDGHTVSLVCFMTKTGELAHLFMMPRSGLSNPPQDGDPAFVKDGAWSTASWSDGKLAMMVATKAPMPLLQEMFGGSPLALLRIFN